MWRILGWEAVGARGRAVDKAMLTQHHLEVAFRVVTFPQKQLCLLLRFVAAVTILFWVGAVMLCTVQCTQETCENDSCHSSAVHRSDHDGDEHDSPSPGHHDELPSGTCLTLKSALSVSNAPAYFHPVFSVFYTLAPLAFTFDLQPPDSAALVLRQARLREFVLTPEVCLGPAFRSLAPPSSCSA